VSKFDGSTRLVHQPVMTAEIVAFLEPRPDGHYLDCTAGAGGHARALLEAGAGQVLALDRDPEVLPFAGATLASWSDRVELVHADFREIDRVLDERGIVTIDGAVADLGMSSMQLETEGRGFSFRRDEPLDMRMDRSQGLTAADLLRDVPEQALADLIFEYGEERFSRRIARAIVSARQHDPLVTTAQLAALVRRVVPRKARQRIDPATRTFQALRIWVNDELDRLDLFLRSVCRRLRAGARLAVMSFHSLEDRIVKTVFRELGKGNDAPVRVLTKRPIRPAHEEVARNPRSRSAKLRAAERLA
jgi:16S rRNA (cytosine1402-N4)-methyltransferase